MIETERLKLIPCGKNHCQAILENEQNIAALLGVELAENWLVFPESVPYILEMLEVNPQFAEWGMYFFVHKTDNKLIGVGGFKGAADETGMVEIGYSIAPEYENRGLATECASAMIKHAFAHEIVGKVDAHTLTEKNASAKVLQKCGMSKIAEKQDAEDGDIWQWRILRADFEKSNGKAKRRNS